MRDALDGDDREVRQQAVIGIAGCAACGVMGWSLVTLRNTGVAFPGPLGLVGAAEGVSHLYVVGPSRGAVKKAKTGVPSRGTRRGPRPSGGVGVPLRPRGLFVLAGQVTDFGFIPNVPAGGRPVLQRRVHQLPRRRDSAPASTARYICTLEGTSDTTCLSRASPHDDTSHTRLSACSSTLSLLLTPTFNAPRRQTPPAPFAPWRTPSPGGR